MYYSSTESKELRYVLSRVVEGQCAFTANQLLLFYCITTNCYGGIHFMYHPWCFVYS